MLAARALGLRPTWALGSAGAIAAFPVLNGVAALSLLREHDEANARAAEAVAARWQAAGREVFDVRPNKGKDINDAIRGDAA
ncbi:MAG TPA: toprim domain-containing protein [Roseiarcus sp.]|nr:toprim domain-containing protein [Roseiarcus sp.]